MKVGDVRRWRGLYMTEAACRHIRKDAPYRPLTNPLHSKGDRGVYDPEHGWYDQTVGVKEQPVKPLAWELEIIALPAIGFYGEKVIITPSWMHGELTEMQRVLPEQWHALREYARGDVTYRIAKYLSSRGRVEWHPDTPQALREAAEVLAHAASNHTEKPPSAPRR